jgi:hypothetical protein
MKKLFYFLLLFSVNISFAAGLVNGNKFYSLPPVLRTKTASIEEIAEHLLNDQKFADLMATFTTNSLAVRKVIVDAAGEDGYKKYEELAVEGNSEGVIEYYESNKIDTVFVCDKASQNLFEWAQFVKNNPDLEELSEEEQEVIFKRMQELFVDDFVNNNPNNPLVEWLRKLLESRTGDLLVAYNSKGGPTANVDSPLKLSISEVGKCLFAAGISFIAGNYKALRSIAGLLDGEWSFSGIRDVISMFIPEAKIASMIVGFVGCIISGMIW